MFGQVAIGGDKMPWKIEQRDGQYCVIKEDDGDVEGCHETEELAKAQMAALYASEGKGIDLGRDSFTVYKQDDGTFRWASVSSVAVKDKEFEIVTEKAQDDAIQHATDTGEFGEIDLVHIEGTDVGKCDFMARAGKRLLESGTFDDSDLARGAIKALSEDPDYWGVSIQFVYDPSKFDGEKYNGNIRIKKRTILPQEMAASYGTKLVAIGGENPMEKQVISDKAREALEKLNVSESEIETLAEKQVEPEQNTVEKEAEAETPEVEAETQEAEAVEQEPETVKVEKTLWEKIKEAFSKPEVETAQEPDAETGGEEVAEVEPVEAQEEETKEVDLAEMVKAMFDAYTEATVEAVGEALKQKDKEIAEIGEVLVLFSEQIKELQAPLEDKVEKRLAELPPIAKAAPTVTAVTEKPPAGRHTFPYQNQTGTGDYVGELMKSVQDAVETVGQKYGKVQT